MQHELDDRCHLLAKVVGDSREFAFNYLLVETLHVVCSERRHEGAHLVEHAAERPNVTLAVVRLVAPHLRTGIVGRSCLSVTQPLLDNLRDVQVSKFRLHVLKEKQIGTLHVPVENTTHVKGFYTSDNLNEDIPDFFLFDVGLTLLIVTDLLKDVAIVRILHHQAQTRCGLVNESVTVRDDIRVVN